MEGIRTYVKESYNELVNKVTWPTWPELQNTTVVVIVGSIILVLITYVMDQIAMLILKNLVY